MNWSEKLKRVWDLIKDQEAKTLYDELRTIKERFRNSLSHGALEKGGMSLFVHIPALGALPASLPASLRASTTATFHSKRLRLPTPANSSIAPIATYGIVTLDLA